MTSCTSKLRFEAAWWVAPADLHIVHCAVVHLHSAMASGSKGSDGRGDYASGSGAAGSGGWQPQPATTYWKDRKDSSWSEDQSYGREDDKGYEHKWPRDIHKQNEPGATEADLAEQMQVDLALEISAREAAERVASGYGAEVKLPEVPRPPPGQFPPGRFAIAQAATSGRSRVGAFFATAEKLTAAWDFVEEQKAKREEGPGDELSIRTLRHSGILPKGFYSAGDYRPIKNAYEETVSEQSVLVCDQTGLTRAGDVGIFCSPFQRMRPISASANAVAGVGRRDERLEARPTDGIQCHFFSSSTCSTRRSTL